MPLTKVPASLTDPDVQGSGPNGSPINFRNRLINGAFGIDQRNAGASQSFTAAAALAYCVDRWYGYCTGANVTGQRVGGTYPNQYNYQFTGAASVTKIGFAQRIEAANCQDLAGTTATLAVDLANTLLTTVTWTAFRANTADAFGTLASPTRTQIATGTFTVSSTLTRYNAQIAIPTNAINGIEVEFSVGAQTSGTWTIGRAQLEQGTIPTPFEVRPISFELQLCQRYFEAQNDETYMGFPCPSTGGFAHSFQHTFKVTKRANPTIVYNLNNMTNVASSSNVNANPWGWTLQLVGSSATNTIASTNWRATAEL